MNNEEIRQKVRDIQFGSEDDAASALMQLTGNGGAASANRIDFQLAFRELAQSSPFVLHDPVLRAAAMQLDQEQIQQGDTRPYSERWADISNTLEEWCNERGFRPTSDPAEVGTSDTIEEMKRLRMPHNGGD